MELSSLELKKYMEYCIELAKQGYNKVRRPFVGSIVISPKGEIVGRGYKTFLDKTSYLIHSERMALDQAGELAKDSTLVTTLEPCIRVKKNQVFKSCSELIVESGIDTVVIGLIDNSRHMNNLGYGIDYLQEHGVNVIIYEDLNEIIKKKLMPYPSIKLVL